MKLINYDRINIFHQKGYWFKIRMEFLWPILAEIELIGQQPQVSGANPTSGVPERMTGGWWGGLAMHWHWGNHMFDPFPVKQPWRKWIIKSHKLLGDGNITIEPGPCFNIMSFQGMGNPMLKIRRSRDHLIFNMGIPMLVRRHLYIEMPPWTQ